MRNAEHDIQVACVDYLTYKYWWIDRLFYAVPNGGARNEIEGAKLKREGVKRGICDLVLDLPNDMYTGLRIEMKRPKDLLGSAGRQSKDQKIFQMLCEASRKKYVVVYSLEEFCREVDSYIAGVDKNMQSRLQAIVRGIQIGEAEDRKEELQKVAHQKKMNKEEMLMKMGSTKPSKAVKMARAELQAVLNRVEN